MDNIHGLSRVTTGYKRYNGFRKMWFEKPINFLDCLGSSVSRMNIEMNKDHIQFLFHYQLTEIATLNGEC